MPETMKSLLENFRDLCQIPSPSLHERRVADVIKAKLRDIGLAPKEDNAGAAIGGDAGNVYVKIPGSSGRPRLLISAHMDTVEDPANPPAVPESDGDWIRRQGGGILGADDKTGVAVMLETIKELTRGGKKHGDLLFVFTVAEEIGLLGSSELDPELYAGYDGGIALDETHPEELITAAPTNVTFRITVHGITGHAAYPERKINAAYVLAQTVARLPMGRLDQFTTANLGIFTSGTAINVIPGTAYAEYELRSHRKDVLDFHVKRVIGIIEGVVRENRTFSLNRAASEEQRREAAALQERISQVDVDVEVNFPGFALPQETKIVTWAADAIRKTGAEPKILSGQGGSDANIFNSRGVPTLLLGTGMYSPHAATERANINDMLASVDVLLNIITEPRTSMRASRRERKQ